MEMRDDIDESDKVIERRHRNKRAVKQVEFEERDDCGYVPKRRAHIHKLPSAAGTPLLGLD